MEVKFGLYVLQTLVLFLFITQCFGNIFVVIDNFTPDAETKVRASNPTNTSTTVATGFFDGNDTLGIERDVSVTVYPGTSARLVSTTFVSGSWSASYVEKVTGRILVQYDGQDGGNINLNLNPGLKGEDLTQSGSAYAMYLQVSSDHPVNYSIAVYGNTPAVVSVYNLTHNAATDKLTDYVIPFSDFVGSATFTSVFGMELALDNNLGGNATDSFVALFGVFGFLVSGTVYYDCNNNGILDLGEVGLPGATVTVTNSVGVVVRTQTTSTDGTYTFSGLLPGTYSICVVSNDPQATPSNPSSGCYRNFVLSGIIDFSGNFGYFVPTVITPPPPKTVECGACLLPFNNCTGAPTIVGCAGVPRITVSDQNTTTCPQIITRTFSAVGATSVQQIITVNDTIKPVITNNQDVTVPCSSKTPSISSWVASHAFASVSDCTTIRWTSNYNNSAAPDCGTFPVTFTATDLCNNAVSFTNNYITTDTVSPQITRAAANQVVNCNINSQSVQNTYNSFVNSHANATAVDDCTSNFALNWTSNAPATITQDCLFNQQVTFRVADVCGNVNTTTSVFTVQDVSPPTITSPARSLTVPCNSPVDQAYKDWLDSHANATATDLCSATDDLEWSNNGGSTPTGCNAANVVTFQVKDSCNKIATTQASFTITSSTGPILDNPAQPLNIDCATNSSSSAVAIKAWLDDNGGARATDNCTGVEWSNNFGSVSGVNCLGIPVTFTACNLCTPKQCVSTTANVTITDSQPPSFRVPPQPEVVDCDDYTAVDFTTWLATGGNAVVRDNCVPDGTTIPITNNWPANTPLPNGCNNTATVTFYATDLCGNTSPGSVATFTVHDVTAPSITKATNISVECNDSNQNSYNNWLANHGLATASDPCSNISWSFIGNSTIPKNCSVTQTVTFIASDACGLKNQTVGSYTLTDRTPPRLTHAAVDLNVTCTTDTFNATLTQWLKSNGGATAVDDCTSVSWSNNYKGLTAGCTQSSLVSFVASDQCGFNVTTAATFSLIDTQQPVIVDFAQSESVPCNSNTTAALKDFLTRHGGATAVDACQPSNNLIWGNNFGTAPTQCRSIEVTFSVTDGCGRFAYTTADFSITDSSAPEITSPAENITVECDGMGNTVQYAFWVSTNAGANAFDFCAINVTWSNDASLTGPVGCGSEKVVFRVTDGCDNFNSTAATFTVADTKPPVISPTAVSTVVECDGSGNQDDLDTFLSSNGGALAHDVCSGSNVVWTYSILNTSSDSFSCTNYTTYTFTVTDQCGQSANTTASFGITDDGKPQIDNPAQPLTIQCGASNNQTITNWLNSNADFQVTDACSSVTYSNNFQNQTNPGFGCFVLPVTFYATDFCGHVVPSVADLTLVDNTPPSFVDFPPDLTLPCDVTTFPEDTGFPKVQDACFSNLDDFVTYHDTTTQGPPDPSTPYCPANKVIVRTFTVKDPCNNSYSQNQTLTIEIARSSGACDSSSCVCDNECCPQPAASDCLAVDCLPQNCAAVLCESVPCSCGFEKRDLPVSFENSPIPQCEPIFIHVADDDDDSVSLTVNAKATLNNYVISDKPIPQEELEKMKSKKVKANKV